MPIPLDESERKIKKIKILLLLPFVVLVILLIYFPGQQILIASVLATGIGKSWLQIRIDVCEEKAIEKKEFSKEEIAFLRNLYSCLHKGARLTFVLPTVSNMMRHYLERTGNPLLVNSSVFRENEKVKKKMNRLKMAMKNDNYKKVKYESDVFYMPDKSNVDSIFGLYYGKIISFPEKMNEEVKIRWRAEVPWEWPSYEQLEKKYGYPHAESFPIPNISCIFKGIEGSIFIDNGLGEYITKLDIAKSFLVYSEWKEE